MWNVNLPVISDILCSYDATVMLVFAVLFGAKKTRHINNVSTSVIASGLYLFGGWPQHGPPRLDYILDTLCGNPAVPMHLIICLHPDLETFIQLCLVSPSALTNELNQCQVSPNALGAIVIIILASVSCDVIKWRHFQRSCPFVRGIHRSPVISPHKGQWRRALTFSLIYAWTNSWVNNRDAGDLKRHRAHYDVTVMFFVCKSRELTTYRMRKPEFLGWRFCMAVIGFALDIIMPS